MINDLSSKHVVLVDENDNFQGIANKIDAHNLDSPLHRGISVFLFNNNKELLIQKRSSLKKTWGSFWSNSFCGHPQIDENYEEAAKRHAKFELGIDILNLFFISKYRYKFELNNIVENEICPIYVSIYNDSIIPNIHEIDEIKWIKFLDFENYIKENHYIFTPWCIEEFAIIKKNDIFSILGL
jgi:isopentenyl-diphosphate delta-isomerase